MNWQEKLNACVQELGKILAEAESSILKFKPCSAPECGRPAVARGLCAKHYREWRKAECLQHGVKTLREIPKAPKVDERQLTLVEVFHRVEPGPPEEGPPDIQF